MDKLTPVDISNKRFRTAMRGYASDEVNPFLEQAAEALSAALQEVDRLSRELSRLEAETAGYRKTEEAIKSALVLAQQAAEDTRVAARQQAEQIVERARQEADREQQRLETIRAERVRLMAECQALVQSFLAALEQHRVQGSTPHEP